MKTDVQNLSTTRVKIVVEIPFDELAEDLKEAYRSIASQVNVPGFRKGKVPARIIDQRFGRGTVLSEVANAVIPRTYDQVIADEEIVPLGQPQVEVTRLEDGEFIEFVAEVDVRPDFVLPPLDGLAVTVDPVSIDEEVVAEEMLNLRRRFAAYNEVSRPAALGDVVLVDVVATDSDGNTVEPYSTTALSYELGAGGAIPGFEEAVAGGSVDEELTFEYIPQEGEFAGEPLTIAVTLQAVREVELPEMDDEFALMASEFDTFDELADDLRNRVRRAGLYEQGAQARHLIRQAYLSLVDIDLPEQLVTDQLADHFSDGHGDEEHRAAHEAEIREVLKANLVFDKLAEEHSVKVEESELTRWLVSQASQYGMTPDQFVNALVSGGQVQAAIAEVRRAKALSLVVDAATITDTEGHEVSLEAIARVLTEGTETGPESQEPAEQAGESAAEASPAESASAEQGAATAAEQD